MNKRIKKKWLKALRSGEYKQCEGQLCAPPEKDNPEFTQGGPWVPRTIPDPEGDHGFCCLGVLQNLYHLEKGTKFTEKEWHNGGLSDAVEKWSGLPSILPAPDDKSYGEDNPDIDQLIARNDGGRLPNKGMKRGKMIKKQSFKQIANWIERHV